MKRKWMLSAAVLLVLACLVLPLRGEAAEIVDSDRDYQNDCSWTLDSDGVLTVTPDYRQEMGKTPFMPWNIVGLSFNEVRLGNGYLNISDRAFIGLKKMTAVTIPDSVQRIGASAFMECKGLTAVTIPDSVTEIGSSAFDSCYNLTSVKLPAGLVSIGDSLFSWCTSLKTVAIPSGVTEIGDKAFYYCTALTSIKLPKAVTSIGAKAFFMCDSLKTIALPEGLASIGNLAFNGCDSLKTITIPAGVKEIGAYAFSNCTGLTSIKLSEGVTSIGEGAFSGCTSLKTITIPAGVKEIGAYAFSNCTGLTSIKLSEGVTSIGEGAFSGCTSLKTITIPSGVEEIGACVFSGCTNLTAATVSGKAASIGESAFAGCESLKKITISGVKEIGASAFAGCTGLTSAKLSEGVTAIGESAFSECENLKEIVLPPGVKEIGASAFSGCTGLTSAKLSQGATSIGESTFSGCENLKEIVLPAGVTEIGRYAFRGCTGLTSVTIPQSVTSIEREAFLACGALADVFYRGSLGDWHQIFGDAARSVIPADVRLHPSSFSVPETPFGDGLFWSMDEKGALTVSGSGVIWSCPWLFWHTGEAITSVEIRDGITEISSRAFQDCTALRMVSLPAGTVVYHAFSGCDSLERLRVTGSGDMAEYGSGEFISHPLRVEIAEGITSVGPLVSGHGLIRVEIPRSVTSIEKRAFADCTGELEIVYAGTRAEWDAVDIRSEDLLRLLHFDPPCCSDDSARKIENRISQTWSAQASSNCSRNNYARTAADTVKSYLTETDSGFLRVEYISGDSYVIEEYDRELRFLSGRTVSFDPGFSLWGGFFAGERYNFVVLGQPNPGENEKAEVLRLIRYDKNWNRLGETGLYGLNTTDPFHAGSLRFSENDGVLWIHTAHQLYTKCDSDGVCRRHQTNMILMVREETGRVIHAGFEVGGYFCYVSHSFNQFVLTDREGGIVTLDHGDAYPRAIVLHRRVQAADSNGSETVWEDRGDTQEAVIQMFHGATGDNTTGASVGGLAETGLGYLAVYSYNGVGANSKGSVMGVATEDPEPVRNAYLAFVSKEDVSWTGVTVRKLTDYPSGGGYRAGNPVIVPIGRNSGYILWEIQTSGGFSTGQLAYVRYAGDGSVSEITTMDGYLSDCQPIVSGDRILWYVTSGSVPRFYTLDIQRQDETGTLGKQAEIQYTWNSTSGILTVRHVGGERPKADSPVIAALYGANGKLIKVRAMTSEKLTLPAADAVRIRLMWLDSAGVPKCRAAEIDACR